MRDPTKRFSDRVESYARYRPSYPEELLRLLEAECGLGPGVRVADVGSGTGILSRLLLKRGARVYGVEPDPKMRETGERLLSGSSEAPENSPSFTNFTSIPGTAESTTLPDSSVELVTAAQAFHWFDPALAREEFVRILAPGGYVVLVWNSPRYEATPFMRDYRRILQRFGTDWKKVSHLALDADSLAPFFGGDLEERCFENRQTLDGESLRGRLLSSSFVPGPGEAGSGPMLGELAEVFERHRRGGEVVFEYEVRVFYGRLEARGG